MVKVVFQDFWGIFDQGVLTNLICWLLYTNHVYCQPRIVGQGSFFKTSEAFLTEDFWSTWLVVYKYYLDDKTTTTFITSFLFVIQKLQQVYVTLKTEKNVFYSAYLNSKVQYNDLDKDKVVKQIERTATIVEPQAQVVSETK